MNRPDLGTTVVDWSELRLVAEAAARSLAPGSELRLGERTLITPLAADAIRDRRIVVVRGRVAAAPPSAPFPASGARIAIGCDHGGVQMKRTVLASVRDLGFAPQDIGCHGTDPVDYPDIAERVAILVSAGAAARGIVLDGAGIGSCMAANKVPGIRAALAYDISSCRNAREHNDANVLTLGARLIGEGLADQLVRTFLKTEFGGERHQKRIDKITALEQRMAGGRP